MNDVIESASIIMSGSSLQTLTAHITKASFCLPLLLYYDHLLCPIVIKTLANRNGFSLSTFLMIFNISQLPLFQGLQAQLLSAIHVSKVWTKNELEEKLSGSSSISEDKGMVDSWVEKLD